MTVFKSELHHSEVQQWTQIESVITHNESPCLLHLWKAISGTNPELQTSFEGLIKCHKQFLTCVSWRGRSDFRFWLLKTPVTTKRTKTVWARDIYRKKTNHRPLESPLFVAPKWNCHDADRGPESGEWRREDRGWIYSHKSQPPNVVSPRSTTLVEKCLQMTHTESKQR